MKAKIRLIAANNFLPIAVTFVCFRFFSNFYTHSVDYFLCLLATFSTWFIYFYDKIIDNKKRQLAANERHALTPLDFKIQICIGVVLAISCVFKFHTIPLNHLLLYASILPLIGVYFIWSKKTQFLSKEIFSTLIITLVVSVFPAIGHSIKINFILHIVFFLMVFSNMLLLSIADYEVDKRNNYSSITMTIGKQKVIILFCLFLLLILGLSIYIVVPVFMNWSICFVVFSYILLLALIKEKLDSILLHVFADSLFLLPLLY